MGKKKQPRFTEEFKQEAVRILITSGRTVADVADDLGVGEIDAWQVEKRYQ